MKFWLSLLMVGMLATIFPRTLFAETVFLHPAPRKINFYLDWYIPDDDVLKLALWDVLVLDMDQQWSNERKIRAIKTLNPNIKILAYISASEINAARYEGDTTSPGYRLASQIDPRWFMYRSNGSVMSWWPNAWLLNATDKAEAVGDRRWNTMLPTFIQSELMSTGLWDGVFLDGAYDIVTDKYGFDIDLEKDGVTNTVEEIDGEWQVGMRKLIQGVREKIGTEKLILLNSGTAYTYLANGVLFENLGEKNWSYAAQIMRDAKPLSQSPKINALNVNTENTFAENDLQKMRFGLVSSLLFDAYYSFDSGDATHHQAWWYDEYAANLGKALSEAKESQGIWSREFENGMVLLNATSSVFIMDTYEMYESTEEPGTWLNELILEPWHGVILKKRPQISHVQGVHVGPESKKQTLVNGH